MILGILLTHLLFLWYSFVYAEDIFEVGHDRQKYKEDTSNVTGKNIFFKFIAMLLYPLMPVYVLAKHSWYESKLRMKRRHLQTDEYGLPEGEYHANSDDEKRKEKIRERIDLYKQVLILETNSLKYGKFYSYFRVTSAVLESTTQVTSKITSTFHNKLSGGGVHSPPIGLRPGWSVCQSLCGRRASSPHSLCHLQRQFAKHLCDPLEHVRHHLCPCEVLVPGQEFGSNSSGSGKLSFPNHTLNPRPKKQDKILCSAKCWLRYDTCGNCKTLRSQQRAKETGTCQATPGASFSTFLINYLLSPIINPFQHL